MEVKDSVQPVEGIGLRFFKDSLLADLMFCFEDLKAVSCVSQILMIPFSLLCYLRRYNISL